MAKIQLGPMVGQASGKEGGFVFSHNRYGTYIRRRAKPTVSTTPAALAQKAALSTVSRAWNDLDAADQEAWRTWAANNPIVDRLGERQILAGNAAFVQLNSRLYVSESGVFPDTPPVASAPEGLLTLTATWDIGAGDFELAFTPTPLDAGQRLMVWAAVVDSPGVRYVENLYRLCGYSVKGQATDYDTQSLIEGRIGSLQVGNIVFLRLQVYDSVTGLVSRPSVVSGTVVSTP